MRIFSFVAMLLLLSACGGSSKTSDSYNPNTKWQRGEFLPSSYYANRCINPRSDSNYQDLVGTYKDENNWLRSWSHETYLWYNELPDIDPALIEDPNKYFDLMKTSSITSKSSQLIVQLKEAHRDAKSNSPKFLSELDEPDRFLLLKNNRGCLIRHKQSQREWYLKEIDCISAERAEDIN